MGLLPATGERCRSNLELQPRFKDDLVHFFQPTIRSRDIYFTLQFGLQDKFAVALTQYSRMDMINRWVVNADNVGVASPQGQVVLYEHLLGEATGLLNRQCQIRLRGTGTGLRHSELC